MIGKIVAVSKSLADAIELLAAVAKFVAGQIQHEGRPALIAFGQFESLVKIGFFNAFDNGGKVDSRS